MRRIDLHAHASGDVGQRLQRMDSQGVDVQILSAETFQHGDDQPLDVAAASARDINDDIAQTISDHPTRFGGLATLPMQDIPTAIEELQRAVGDLGLNGVMIADNVNGKLYDEPEFLPFFTACEELGALIYIHHLGSSSRVTQLNPRYDLPTIVGNPLDRTIAFASLVFGGVMDACPDLKVVLAHGGGYVSHGIGRMDHGWSVRPEARANISEPPSSYLRRFSYDSLTHSEAALRYLISVVGSDRVVLGTDGDADLTSDGPLSWILAMESLTDDEKELMLSVNLAQLLNLKAAG